MAENRVIKYAALLAFPVILERNCPRDDTAADDDTKVNQIKTSVLIPNITELLSSVDRYLVFNCQAIKVMGYVKSLEIFLKWLKILFSFSTLLFQYEGRKITS